MIPKLFPYLFVCILLPVESASGQTANARSRFIDVDLGIGKSQGNLSAAFIYEWRVGEKQKFGVGTGIRFTSYLGKNQYYATAPAKLTSGETGPQVLFIENIKANMDTFLVKTAQVNALNIPVYLSCKLSDRFLIGFNIDLIGFSFGAKVSGNYINGFQGMITDGKPTALNVLLISDNDLGTLNSALYGKYALREKIALKAGMQFLFTEYTTETKVQQFPDANDRFRKKSLLLAVGVSFDL